MEKNIKINENIISNNLFIIAFNYNRKVEFSFLKIPFKSNKM